MAPPAPAKGRTSALRAYLTNSAAPVQAAALTLPLLVLYGLGMLFFPAARNGVDLVSVGLRWALGYLGPSRAMGYLGFYGALIAINAALFWHLSRKNKFNIRYFWPLLGESAFYAVLTGWASTRVTSRLVDVLHAGGDALPAKFGVIDGIFVSAGAGLHEELLFRLIGIGLVGWMWLGSEWRRPSLRLLGLVLATSVVFSAMHHIVEPFTLTAFVFRTVAGMMFATLFLFRGFAVAAWTHALYDLWVIVLIGA